MAMVNFLFGVIALIFSVILPLIVYLHITKIRIGRKIFLGIILGYYAINIIYNVAYDLLNEPAWLSLLFGFLDSIYLLCIAFITLKIQSKTLKFFYGLFPYLLWNLFQRSLAFFIVPSFGLSNAQTNEIGWLLDFLSYLAVLLIWLYLHLFKYQINYLRNEHLSPMLTKLLVVANLAMGGYIVAIELLTFLEFDLNRDTLVYRESLVFIYLLAFTGFMALLDRERRERDYEARAFEQRQHVKNIEAYSHKIEDLYKDIRSFRHDYVNLLTTLRLGIETNDMATVAEVYHSVLEGSDRQFLHQKYDIGRLVNLKNEAIKSLIVSKILRAQAHQVAVAVEIPDEITPQGMAMIDLITIISVLCDNAVEAALEVAAEALPSVTIAYVTQGQRQLFIVANTTAEECVDISYIFDYGQSSKGEDRGIGLNNVVDILDKYPNVMLKTHSQNYVFKQSLEIEV